MTDLLLFLHVLAAAALVTALVAFSAVAVGAQLPKGSIGPFKALWHVGLVGVFILGIALAIDIDGYEIWDRWVLIALALWLVVGAPGERLPRAYSEAGAGTALPASAIRAHWITVALVLLLLADMIGKPWA